MIIYQILPRLWGNMVEDPEPGACLSRNGCGKFGSIDTETLQYIRSLGVSHIWYTGVIRHATPETGGGCESSGAQWTKGSAGSPFAINDYYDVNPYLADNPAERLDEFKSLVRRTHAAGMKVLIDFVPNHVARDYGAFSGRKPDFGSDDDPSVHWKSENDFFYYPGEELRLPKEGDYHEFPAKASGNVFSPAPGINDWYETVRLNYCDYHTATWDKMLNVLLFWTGLGVDGFRCDMAELVPMEFLSWAVREVKAVYPDVIFIGEVYRKEGYWQFIHEGGFDYLYDKSGLYDALAAIVRKNTEDDGGVPSELWQSTRLITWNWQRLGDLQPHMLNFLENHDEQRFASDFFGRDARNAFAALYVSLFFNTCPFMLYFGQEIGERGMDAEGLSDLNGRTSIFDWWSVASLRRLWNEIHGCPEGLNEDEKQLLERYREALNFAADNEAITKGNTYDLRYCNLSSDGFNEDRHFAFLRHYGSETLLIVCNFSRVPASISISVPSDAFQLLDIAETPRLNSSIPLKVDVPAFDGVVLRF